MSIASPLGSVRVPSAADAQTLRTLIVRPVEAAAFWAAILVPVAYPALLIGGLDGQQLTLLAALLVVNALALLLGRGHNRD